MDNAPGAPAVKLGAYALEDPPRAPTPEMMPLEERMVIDVPSEGEEDTVSLREDDAPIPQGIKLSWGSDGESDYGEDPETFCGPIIETTPVAGPSYQKHKWTFPPGYMSKRSWADDDEAYDGPTENESVPSCSHQSALLTDPSIASISLDVGRSLDRNLATYNKIYCEHVLHCADCKGPDQSGFIEWIVDSGASFHFTGDKSDFSDFNLFPEKDQPKAQTANGVATILGHGTVFVRTWIDHPTKPTTTINRLHLVFYMENIGVRLLSMGQILKGNMHIKGDE